jgi:hypothetical protein
VVALEHDPALQNIPGPHTRPHAPQLFESVLVLTHRPPQNVVPGAHGIVHMPIVHIVPNPHARPHAPQFIGSIARFTHRPKQLVSPGGQIGG